MQARQMLTEQALHKLFERVRGASFAVTYKNGATMCYGDGEPQFTIRFNDDDILGLLHGDLLMNFGEAYMDGRVNLEGDLADLMSLALRSGLMSVTQTAQGFVGKTLRAAARHSSRRLN